jgi:hypothetical protein
VPRVGPSKGGHRLPAHEPAAAPADQPSGTAEPRDELGAVVVDDFFRWAAQGRGVVPDAGEVCASATGGPALAALLGAAWGSQSAERERRNQRLRGQR